jgi:hypothetical protein
VGGGGREADGDAHPREVALLGREAAIDLGDDRRSCSLGIVRPTGNPDAELLAAEPAGDAVPDEDAGDLDQHEVAYGGHRGRAAPSA